MASLTQKIAEKLILESTTIAEKKNSHITPEILMEASENIRKTREPAPEPPEGGISLAEAEREFNIPYQTISRWAKRGYIDILLETTRELYIDKIQLENIIGYYKQDPGQGKFTLRYLFGKKHPRSKS